MKFTTLLDIFKNRMVFWGQSLEYIFDEINKIEATHERAAAVKYFSKNCPDGYFPEFRADGDIECIYDADGDCIMGAGQTSIYYDGGYFEAELITGE